MYYINKGLVRLKITEEPLYNAQKSAYMAPEVVIGETDAFYDSKVDIYSLSITIWEMFYRRTPFLNSQNFEICNRILSGERPQFDGELNSELRNILSRWKNMSFIISFRGWSEDRNLRPAIEEFKSVANKLVTIKNPRNILPPVGRKCGRPIGILVSDPDSKRLKYKKDEVKALFENQGLLDSKVFIILVIGFISKYVELIE